MPLLKNKLGAIYVPFLFNPDLIGGGVLSVDTSFITIDSDIFRADNHYNLMRGPELVTNGIFLTDSDWTKDGGWSIENGQAICNGVGINSLQQSGITTTGKTYKLTFDIISKSSDDFLVISTNFGDTYINGSSTSLGTNTFFITPTSGTGVRFRAADGTSLSIDNVSVTEDRTLGPELVLNGDYSQEGSELITNGDFSVNGIVNTGSYTLGWYSPDSGISISDGKLIITNGGSIGGRAYGTNGVDGISFITSGKSYKLVYTIEENNDNASVLYHNGGSYVTAPNTVGTHTIYYQADGAIFILRNNTANATIKIDNVSVKEVGQNWTFGSGWSVDQANSKAVSDTTASNLTPSTTLISGRKYKFSLNSEAVSSGSYSFLLRFNSTNTDIGVINSDGSHEFAAIADSTSFRLQTLSGGSTNFSITNISVVEDRSLNIL